ncbi:hypothetical protein [Halarcobacter bivalviorum]|uniref:hypothetical protein n=1 Tax=Halarcobacter bivalviorum TaxID=663364 RepID=UPI00100BDB5D|nr:hypothetical protein [Halarcobacter bivalviorum]RXK05807.1 hypothetical protein CRU97_07820 [Halarcobacter bivalviorum]
MIKTLFSSIYLIVLFSGCFSVSSLNPFSDDTEETQKKQVVISDNAPIWIKNPNEKNYISVLGYSFLKQKEVSDFDKKRTLLNASNNLSKKIYKQVVTYYKEYEEKLDRPSGFDKDIHNIAEQISLKALSKSKIKDSWLSEDNTLFVKIAIDSDFVATQIQNESKNIYKVDETLYKNVLSNRAKALLIEYLEK